MLLLLTMRFTAHVLRLVVNRKMGYLWLDGTKVGHPFRNAPTTHYIFCTFSGFVSGLGFIQYFSNIKRIFTLFTFILLVVIAQGQRYNFRSMGDLFPSECYCVLQDSKGFIWVSSERGLFKYDGNRVKRFDMHNGMRGPDIFQLCEDHQGRILFADHKSDIGYVDGDTVVFPKLNDALGKYLEYGRSEIFDEYVDKDNILWLSTYAGVFKTTRPGDLSNIEKEPVPDGAFYRTEVAMLDGKKTLCPIFIPSGYIVKNDSVFFRLYVPFSGKPASITYGIKKDQADNTQHPATLLPDGTVLWSQLGMLYTISPDGHYTKKDMGGLVDLLKYSKNGGVWVGIRKHGIFYYDNTELKGHPVQSLDGCSVTGLLEDAEGGVWVTTLEKGVFYSASTSIIDYTNVNGLDSKISGMGIVNSKVMVNNYNGFLTVIDDKANIKRVDIPGRFGSYSVFSYAENKGLLYLAASPKTLVTDTAFKTWTEVILPANGAGIHVAWFAQPDGDTIYGVLNSGVYSFKGGNCLDLRLLPARGRSIYVTHDKRVLIGTTNGLFEFKDEKFIDLGITKNFSGIKEDKQGNIWLITDQDVNVMRNGRIIKTIDEDNGLPYGCTTYDIAIDDAGNAWVGTSSGVSRISPAQNYAVQNFDEGNGLIAHDALKMTINHNQLWIGTGTGLCMMDIANMPLDNNSPRVYIESVTVNDSRNKNKTVFSHTEDNFLFHLQALTFKDTKQRFIYRLVGLDTAWHTSGFPDIQFSNLSAGQYRFEAKAINKDGVPSSRAAIFSFTIDKPFWKEWWFIILEMCSVGALIYAFINFRLRNIKEKEEEKTKVNKMLSEYQMTALRAQMNPHFVFNAINSVQEYILDNEPQKAYDYLTKFAQLVRIVLNNAKEKYISLEKDLETLEVYMDLEQLRFGDKFEYLIDIDEKIDSYNIQLPAMLIQPYVENAIWHGIMPLGGQRKGRLIVRIWQRGNELNIIVEDNGVGRESAAKIKKMKQHKSVGMELTKQRLDMLNNLPEYRSSDIEIYDLRDESGKPAGTRVEIKITYKS
jgi:ligand-binding sensor domain-containing protein